MKVTGLATLGTAMGCDNTPDSDRSGDRSGDRPNIIFIFSDDHADRAMSCYGSIVNTTPNLDRIAEGGMRFDRAYITQSLCAPSRASVLTGTYPHVNGQMTIGRLFDGSQVTFPQLLQQSGYETAIFGKWHLHSDPTGFDHWNVLIGQGPYFDPPMIENGTLRNYSGYTTDIITDRCLDWLDERDGTKPFMLCCHHKAPHWVTEPDEKHEHMYDGVDFPVPETFDDDTPRSYAPEIDWTIDDLHERYQKQYSNPRWANLPEGLSPTERKKDNYNRFMRDYLGAIASMDDNIGRLLDWLEESGQADNTIVIYAADNGYYMGEHGWIDKKTPYEESLRIPLLVRWPGVTEPGSTNTDFVANIDFAPTILDMAGIEAPECMQGRSFQPQLEGTTPGDWREVFYFQYYTIKEFQHYGIRTPRYKLIHFYEPAVDAWEMYDLERDPNELVNVYADASYAADLADLMVDLATARAQYGINAEMDLAIIEESQSGGWGRKLREFLDAQKEALAKGRE